MTLSYMDWPSQGGIDVHIWQQIKRKADLGFLLSEIGNQAQIWWRFLYDFSINDNLFRATDSNKWNQLHATNVHKKLPGESFSFPKTSNISKFWHCCLDILWKASTLDICVLQKGGWIFISFHIIHIHIHIIHIHFRYLCFAKGTRPRLDIHNVPNFTLRCSGAFD